MIYLGVEYGAKYTLECGYSGGTQTNLVPNASFENGVVTGWADSGTGVTVTSLEVVKNHATNGAYALFYIPTNASGVVKSPVIATTAGASGITVTEGLPYTLRLDSYLFSLGGGAPRLVITWYKAAGTLISTSSSPSFSASLGASTLSLTATAPAEAARAAVGYQLFELPTGKSGAVFIDSVQFEQATAASQVFTPTKAQVENGDVVWSGTAWASAATYKQHIRAVFNDPTDPDFVGVLSPESSGLDAPEIREDAAERVESDGAIFGNFFAGKRPVILQGEISATSKAQRNERIGKLRAASNAKTENAVLSWEDAIAGKLYINMRRQQPLRITGGWLKQFQAAMVAADSRILSYAPVIATAKGITHNNQVKPPTVTGQIPRGAPSTPWVNTNNIKASDNVYATETYAGSPIPELTQILYGKTFGFTLPTNAVVTDVFVNVEHKGAEANVFYPASVTISRDIANEAVLEADRLGQSGGEAGGGYKTAPSNFPIEFLSAVDVTKAFGGGLWQYGKFLTPEIINSANFGAGINYITDVNGKALSVDSLAINVEYAEPLKVTATNEGDVPAPALIQVRGPLENFYILNQANGEQLTYTGKIEAGKEIWFDTESITATEHGTGITEPINRFNNVGPPGDWIRIQPGSNSIVVAGSGGSSASELSVEYRNAWE